MSSGLEKIDGDSDGELPIIGTIDMLSTPAAIITSDSPTRMRSAAICTADRPDAQKRYSTLSPAERRDVAEGGTLYGTPDEIAAKLQALHDVGAEYVLLNSAGGPASLRCFAQEIMPAFR